VLWIESSSRVDPLRNVHVWLPGTYAERPLFWPPYVARVQALNHGCGPQRLAHARLDARQRLRRHGSARRPSSSTSPA
jgi:hypothetical protein